MRTTLRLSICLIAGTVFLWSISPNAHAAVTVLTAIDAGFVTPPGGSAKGDATLGSPDPYNYSVGRELHYTAGAPGPMGLTLLDRKNYIIFDLTSITDPIVSASVSIYSGPGLPPAWPGGTHGYESADTSEFFEFHATADNAGAIGDAIMLAAAPPADFDAPGDPGVMTASALFTKLAMGPPIAGKMYSPADDGTTATILLADLTFLNSHLGSKVILAGVLPSSTIPTSTTTQEIFGFTGPDILAGDPLTPTLTITTVPEPSALGAVLLLLGGLACRARQFNNSRLQGEHTCTTHV